MAERVTRMKLNVFNLQCSKCYNKVKNVLCKFPQIRSQDFDVMENIVTIIVVCCSPEKIRDKICYKGGGAIKSIEIVEPARQTPSAPPLAVVEPRAPPLPVVEPSAPPLPVVEPTPPPPVVVTDGVFLVPGHEWQPGGPSFHGFGGPTIFYDGYCGRPVYDSYGGPGLTTARTTHHGVQQCKWWSNSIFFSVYCPK